MPRVVTEVFTVTVQRWKKEPITGDGVSGYRTKDLPPTQERVEVTIDLEAVAKHLGPKAARSKGGKSVDGFVTVKHIRTRKV